VTPAELDRALAAAVEAARAAGEVALKYYRTGFDVTLKADATPVTQADQGAEQAIREVLGRAFPAHGFLGEEFGAVGDQQHRWIIDPIDGTTNFLHGLPIFCIAIALERDGEIVCALVYNPILDELYTAEKGQGAFVNSRRLRVAARKQLSDCVVSIGIPHRGRPEHPRFLSECRSLMEQEGGLRRTGSAAIDLARVAAGRFDGYVEHHLKPWDVAAGTLLVREAGGFVTDAAGGQKMFDTGSIVAGNQTVHKALLAALAGSAAPA